MTLHYQESDPIILGSGEIYIGLSKNIVNPELLTTEEEASLINVGSIESGCTIDISTTKVDVHSDNRGIVRRFTTDKSVKLKTGVMSWVLDSVSKYLTGSKFTTNETTGEKKMVIGFEDDSPQVYVRFIHDKSDGGQLIVNLYKAQFDGDLSFVFNKEKATTINYEFLGMTHNKNYVEFIETFPPVPPVE